MIVPIAPKFKFVCDRCGKEIFPKDDDQLEYAHAYEIKVSICDICEDRFPVRIQVCRECRDEFEVFWENFRDSVNKEVVE